MSLYILIFCCLAVVVGGFHVKDDVPELGWPTTYTIDAKKLTLSSGLNEDLKIWNTLNKSRVDYNKGAVKSIAFTEKKGFRFGVKYEIHPESNEEYINKMVCTGTRGKRSSPIELHDILPDVSGLEQVGEENVRDINTVKFYSENVDDKTAIKMTLWATYKANVTAWIPIRYEKKSFNTWLGYQDVHEIWEFYNFNTKVVDDVFDVSDYLCAEEDSLDDEVVTKHLRYMDPEKDKHVDHVFDVFQQKYNKKYANEQERKLRRRIFQNNMRLIISNNRQNLGYKLAVNQFADLTHKEIARHKGLLRRTLGDVGTIPFPYTESQVKEIGNTLPLEYDARLYGLVSPIKNQESCGSCWTFGTTASVEGALARSNGGRLLTLSNQALVDCAWGFGNSGCDGGSDSGAYKWIMKYGLPTEEAYGTYANQDGYCLIDNMTETFKISGFTDVTPYSVTSLKFALINHGPLSVSLNAISSLIFYSGGIYYDPECDPTQLDHEVTLVGYSQKDGEDYWIVKNSWGPNWGVDGYLHISTRDNNCGVATEPTYAVI